MPLSLYPTRVLLMFPSFSSLFHSFCRSASSSLSRMFFSLSNSSIHFPTYAPHSPIVVVLAAVGMSHTLRTFLNPAAPSKAIGVQSVSQEEEKQTDSEGKSEAQDARLVSRALITMLLLFLLSLFVVHSTWVTSTAYSSPSVVLASSVRSFFSPFLNQLFAHSFTSPQNRDGSRNIMDDFREAYFWLRQNTAEDATVCVHVYDQITLHSFLLMFHSTGHVLV
jgi:hypothetical protein